MTVPASNDHRPLPAGGPRWDKVLVRDALDVNRLCIHLVTHWKVPRIEIGTDRFPQLAAQRAQDRIARLSKACNCIFGEGAGALTLLFGAFAVWVSSSGWRGLAWVLLAASGVALIGKGIELTWTRVRLLLVLRDLLRRLDTSADLPTSNPVRHDWLGSDHRATLRSAPEMTQEITVPRLPVRRALRHPRTLLRNTADISLLCLHLVTHWSIPRIEIHIEGVPGLEVQRAQHRYDQLSGGANFMLAGVMTVLTLLGGLLYVLWQLVPDASPAERLDQWLEVLDWSKVQPVVVAALCAGILGWVIEVTLTRMQLLKVLRKLRRHDGKA